MSWFRLALYSSVRTMENPDEDDPGVALAEAARQEVRLSRWAFESWSYDIVILHGLRAVEVRGSFE